MYVDNKKLHEILSQWLTESADNDSVPMPNYVGFAIKEIATGFANKHNWRHYTWKDDLIGDAILNCVKYIKNYNPEKYHNPHAYITMCCESVMKQRNKKEKRQLATKYKFFMENFEFESEEFDVEVNPEFVDDMMLKISDYEKTRKNDREKRRKSSQKLEEKDEGLDI